MINANLTYIDQHRRTLKKQYADFADFNARFEIPQAVIDKMVDEAREQKIVPKDEAELQQTLPQLRLQLKALIARDLWDMSEYFQVMNTQNAIVQRAVQLIQ